MAAAARISVHIHELVSKKRSLVSKKGKILPKLCKSLGNICLAEALLAEAETEKTPKTTYPSTVLSP